MNWLDKLSRDKAGGTWFNPVDVRLIFWLTVACISTLVFFAYILS